MLHLVRTKNKTIKMGYFMRAPKVLVGVLALSSSMWAAVYTSEAAFAAATRNPTMIGFNGILAPGQSFADFNPLTVSGNSFSTPNPGTFVNVTKNDFYGPGFTYPADFTINSFDPGVDNELDVKLAAPTLALGLDYGASAGGGLGTFTLSDGTSFAKNALPALGNTAFVGFVSSTPITSFSFVATKDAWVVLDMVVATPVPEPRSYTLLLIGGFAGILALKLKHLRRTA